MIICMDTYAYLFVYIHMFINSDMLLCSLYAFLIGLYVWVGIHTYNYAYIYTYIYIYIYIYIHIYIYL
jgi:hypothetical protein